MGTATRSNGKRVSQSPQKGKHLEKRGGKFLPALFRILGSLLLAAVILSALPLTVPRLLGYRVYTVISGSMEPALPAGSLVYVKAADPVSVNQGEIIAFSDDGAVVTHRVMQNLREEGSFITRGDANNTDDLFPVSYRNLIGRVEHHVPLLGALMQYFVSVKGKIMAVAIVLGGLLLSSLGGSLRDKPERKGTQK